MRSGGYSSQPNKITEPDLKKLWHHYKKGPDKDAAYTRLVEVYLPLVVRIVERLSIRVRQKMEKDELVSAGVLGLHQALRAYSFDRGVEFEIYARKRVRGSILDELRRQDHLSRGQRQEYRKICETIRKITETNGVPPNEEELAKAVGKESSQIQYLIELACNAVSLYDDTQDGLSYIDYIADENSASPSEQADLNISREVLREAYRSLEVREQQLLFLRHYQELRVKEIAEVMGISEGRISQIYKQIILKLRACIDVNQMVKH